MRRNRLAPLALALALSTGCGGLTRNHTQGLAVVGGVAVVMGGTVVADGWSCDEATWSNASCEHDGAELRNGAILITAGAALLGWAVWRLVSDPAPPEPAATRTARSKSAPAR